MNANHLMLVVITLVLAALAAPAAHAQRDTPILPDLAEGPQIELFASGPSTGGTILGEKNQANFGLRGSFHVTNRFVVEGSATRLGDYGLWLADLSTKYYLKNRGRTAVYLLGGPGWAFNSHGDTSEMLVHAGLGVEMVLGRNVFLRPEIRERSDLDFEDFVGDFSIALGWRF